MTEAIFWAVVGVGAIIFMFWVWLEYKLKHFARAADVRADLMEKKHEELLAEMKLQNGTLLRLVDIELRRENPDD